MGSKKSQEVERSSPDDARFRPDAVVVYRALQSAGPLSAVDLALRCFPTPTEGPASSVAAIQRRSVGRVYDAIVWMRHHDVVIGCAPRPDHLSVFGLGRMEGEVSPLRATPLPERVSNIRSVVTAKVSQPDEDTSSDHVGITDVGGMDIWHGR